VKKKEIKELLSRFDEMKMPDGQKIISSCGAEYRYVPREKSPVQRKKRISLALVTAIIIMLIASAITVAANSESVEQLWQYVETKIRVFYGDGSYKDEVIGGYVPVGTGSSSAIAQTAGQTQRPPDGIIQNPEYWDEHKKDVSGYTATVTHVQQGSERIILHINGGEEFKVYKNYVKLERKKKMTFGAKWENIYERLLPEYGMESGNTTAPTTGVYDGEGNFVAEIDGLAELLAGEAADFEYRITIKVCSPKGAPDEGDITVKFDPKNFE
jgi:hypothetical protein